MTDETRRALLSAGTMADLVRAHDWAKTSIGPMDAWPQSLRTAVDMVLDAGVPLALCWGPELLLLYNDAYSSNLGGRHPAALGRPMLQVWADAQEAVRDDLERVLTSGTTVSFQDRMFLLDAGPERSTRWFTGCFSPIRDESGRIAGIFNPALETTERVLAERTNTRLLTESRDNEQRLRLAMQSSTLGYWEMDPPSRRVKWSENTLRMFGYEGRPEVNLSEPVGRMHPEDRERVVAAIDAAIGPKSDGSYASDYRVLRPDGTVRWLKAVGQTQFQVRDGVRQAVRIAGVVWDVTEQQQLIEQLREVDRRKDEFIAILSHELRGPLAPLRNALWMLQRSPALTQQDRETLAIAERQRRQLAYLVGDLLEMGRVTSGRIELRREPMLIGTAVRAAVESLRPSIDQRGQRITVAIPDQPVRIVADPARVAQVLENLLTNASKYTRPGGHIHIEAEKESAGVAIRVTDDGIGIEPSKQGTLFQPFSQIDASIDRAQGGLGIGLALVKRLVELHGGSVEVHSDGIGMGSTFTVRLPATIQAA